MAGSVVSSLQSSQRSRGTVPLEDLALQERDSIFRAPSGGDWMLLGLVTLGLLGTGLYDWMRLGTDDHTGRAVFFGLMLVAIFWGALVYIFKLSMCVQVGPHGISLVRGPWRTELFWRDTARLVERTLPDGGQRFRWVVVMARDGRELRVREDMVANYVRFRAEVYERYLLWRDHGGTWGASGSGPFTATDIVANSVAWWLFAGGLVLLPGLYFWFLLPETGLTGLALIALTILCCVEALATFLGRQTYTVGPKEITRKRPAQPTTQLRWRNVSRIDRARHPAGGLIRVAIAIGRLLMEIAARTDSRFKSFAWSPRVPEYLTLRGEGRHVQIRLHRLTRPDEMLAWVEYYERIGRRGATSQSEPVAPPQQGAAGRPAAYTANLAGGATPRGGVPAGVAGAGPFDPWAEGFEGALPADAYPTELQPAVNASRPPASPFPARSPAGCQICHPRLRRRSCVEDERPEDDSWLWDTNKMPKVSAGALVEYLWPSGWPTTARRSGVSAYSARVHAPTNWWPSVYTAGGRGAPAESSWWLTADAPASPAAPHGTRVPSAEAPDLYPPVNYPEYPNYPPAPEYPSAYPPPDDDQPSPYAAFAQQPGSPRPASPPFVQHRQEYPPPEPPEEQGPSEREVYDENLAESQKWRKQQNWQPPTLPRFGPPPPEGDDRQK